MKEVKLDPRVAYTDQLDVRRPYLVFDKEKGTYHILYWWATFDTYGKWWGSSWYSKPPVPLTGSPSLTSESPLYDIGRDVRVWKLPNIKYKKARTLTNNEDKEFVANILKEDKLRSVK